MLSNIKAYLFSDVLELLDNEKIISTIDIDEEELDDYWNSFEYKGKTYDINIYRDGNELKASAYEIDEENFLLTEPMQEIKLTRFNIKVKK